MSAHEKCIFARHLTLALAVILNAPLGLADAKSQGALAQSATKRTLHFPKGPSLGAIHVGNGRLIFGPFIPYKQVAGAAGNVTIDVPAGQRVLFEANRRVFEDPSLLDKISPVGIDGLKLGFISLDDREDQMCDRALAHVGHFQGLTDINIDRSEATDAGVAKLKNVKSLIGISCFYSSIDGSCFKDLAQLPTLKALWAPNCHLNQKNLQYLSQFPRLQLLNLDWTHLDETGAKNLSNCLALEDLSVRGNHEFDDKCLAYIRPLKNLKSLQLQDTHVTLAGLKLLHLRQLNDLFVPLYMEKDLSKLRQVFPMTKIFAAAAKGRADEQDVMICAPLH